MHKADGQFKWNCSRKRQSEWNRPLQIEPWLELDVTRYAANNAGDTDTRKKKWF